MRPPSSRWSVFFRQQEGGGAPVCLGDYPERIFAPSFGRLGGVDGIGREDAKPAGKRLVVGFGIFGVYAPPIPHKVISRQGSGSCVRGCKRRERRAWKRSAQVQNAAGGGGPVRRWSVRCVSWRYSFGWWVENGDFRRLCCQLVAFAAPAENRRRVAHGRRR